MKPSESRSAGTREIQCQRCRQVFLIKTARGKEKWVCPDCKIPLQVGGSIASQEASSSRTLAQRFLGSPLVWALAVFAGFGGACFAAYFLLKIDSVTIPEPAPQSYRDIDDPMIAEPYRIACIGDSISTGKGLPNPESECWPAVLQKLLGSHYQVRNFSVAGRSVLWKSEFPFTREKAYSEALAYKPELVLILLGSNDVLPQNWKYEKEFEMDYRRLIESFKVGFGKKRIILCTPTPDFESAAADSNQSILERELLPRIRRVGSDLKLPIVDLYTPLRGRPELFPDKFHPNEEGSKAIASLVFAAL